MTDTTKATSTKATSTKATDTSADGFTDDERAAMKERAKELKTTRRSGGKGDGEADLLEKIAEMPAADRVIAEQLHAVVMASAPDLVPKTWYGQPAYAKDGKVVCFFQSSAKFKTRYATLGFSDEAKLDDGDMWPAAYALVAWTPAVADRVKDLVKRAVS